MKITNHYQISYSEFLKLYRVHSHVKFHLRRYMILAVILFCLGEVFEKFLNMDFASINSMIFIILVVSIALNILADFVLPKQAYHSLKMNHQEEGTVTITEDALIFGEGRQKLIKQWSAYTSCIETDTAFLLYQRDQFTILLKEVCGSQIENVRELLKEKVNKGKKIKVKA